MKVLFRLPARALMLTALFAVVPMSLQSAASRGARDHIDMEVERSYQARSAEEQQSPTVPSPRISFRTTEGTYMNIDVSPGGDTIVFDLLGDIYSMPIVGGRAVAMTSGISWDHAPRFSPNGKSVYFVSDRRGYHNIWRLNLGDQSIQQVTESNSDIVGALNWSQDGNHLLVGRADAGTKGTEFLPHRIDPRDGGITAINAPEGPWIDMAKFRWLRDPIHIFSAVESVDGFIYFSRIDLARGGKGVVSRLHRYDINADMNNVITPKEAQYNEYKPHLSRDGKLLSYFRQYDDRRTEIRIFDRSTGSDRSLIVLPDSDDAFYRQYEDLRPNYAFTPDNRALIFWHQGEIHRISLTEGRRKVIPFEVSVERDVWARATPARQRLDSDGEARAIRWPNASADERTLVFAAIGYVWLMDLTTMNLRRLTNSDEFEFMPALSPDGNKVAFTSFDSVDGSYGGGRLVVADVREGSVQNILAHPNEMYLDPNWSQDGSKIALIREARSTSGYPDEGMAPRQAAVGWVSSTGGVFHEVADVPPSTSLIARHLYSRSVGFDMDGNRLIWSFPRSATEVVLAAADLTGGSTKTLAVSTPEVAGINPAPNLDTVVITKRDGTLWQYPLSVGEKGAQISTRHSAVRQISESASYYVNWYRPDRLVSALGQQVYLHDLSSGGAKSLRVSVEFQKPSSERPVAFTGARIITMSTRRPSTRVIETGTIVVRHSRITAIGPVSDIAIPSNAFVIDVAGKVIVPGLIDTHYHRIGGKGVSAYKLPNDAFDDESAIRYGITTAWEPGGPVNDGAPAMADLQAAGRIVGPRWSHSAEGAVGYPYDDLTTYNAALASVEQRRQLGVAVLKEYLAPTRQQRQWLSAAAREKEMGIISHLNSFHGMLTRVVDGYSGGDHTRIPIPFYLDVTELLRQTGYIWTPNILIGNGTIGTMRDAKDIFCREIVLWQKRTGRAVDMAESSCQLNVVDGPRSGEPLRVERIARQVAEAAAAGVHIGVSGHNMPAINLHWEMWLMADGGIAVDDVLRLVTIGNAEKLGLQHEVGSLDVGKVADFLVLHDDPRNDVLNLLALWYTVQGGVIYNSASAQPIDRW